MLIVRYALQVVIFSIVIKYDNIRVRDVSIEKTEPSRKFNQNRKVFILLIFQGLCNGIGMLGEFICVSLMPLGDASALIVSTPVPSMILSRIFLGHRLRLYKIICGLMVYLGILFVIQPPFIFHR